METAKLILAVLGAVWTTLGTGIVALWLLQLGKRTPDFGDTGRVGQSCNGSYCWLWCWSWVGMLTE